jgi:hypothetical protein
LVTFSYLMRLYCRDFLSIPPLYKENNMVLA